MDVNDFYKGLKVRVITLQSTAGMAISPKHLDIRQVGKVGKVLSYVPGHGGDVWFVMQDNGIAAYCYTELQAAQQPAPAQADGDKCAECGGVNGGHHYKCSQVF